MPFPSSTIIGTIAVQPFAGSHSRTAVVADDSSLDALLASLAHCPLLDKSETDAPVRLIASARLSRFTSRADALGLVICADLARLVIDLEHEYALLTEA
jgi:hypothetical protein